MLRVLRTRTQPKSRKFGTGGRGLPARAPGEDPLGKRECGLQLTKVLSAAAAMASMQEWLSQFVRCGRHRASSHPSGFARSRADRIFCSTNGAGRLIRGPQFIRSSVVTGLIPRSPRRGAALITADNASWAQFLHPALRNSHKFPIRSFQKSIQFLPHLEVHFRPFNHSHWCFPPFVPSFWLVNPSFFFIFSFFPGPYFPNSLFPWPYPSRNAPGPYLSCSALTAPLANPHWDRFPLREGQGLVFELPRVLHALTAMYIRLLHPSSFLDS